MLVAAIARGDRVGALAIVQAALAVEGHGLVEAAWGHAAADAGRLAADEAPDLPVRKRLSFNFLAPSTFSILSRWASQLRRSLETIALRAVSLALDRGLTAQASPEAVADDMLASLGLTERQAQAVANYRAYLENLDRAALRSQLRDARNDPRVLNAIREQAPLPAEYVDRLVARYEAKLEASRAAVIGRTEALRARWTGIQALWEQQVSEGLVSGDAVVKRWHHRHDNRVRTTHLSIPDIQPDGVPLNGTFRTSGGNELAFPGDPSAPMDETIACRCFLSYVVRSEALVA